jgi:hypothetical protein
MNPGIYVPGFFCLPSGKKSEKSGAKLFTNLENPVSLKLRWGVRKVKKGRLIWIIYQGC